MAKNWKKSLPALLAIYGLLLPVRIVGQESLPVTIFKGIDQIGQKLIQNRQKQHSKNPSQSSLYKPRTIHSKYFPRCQIHPSKNNFPENVCRNDLPVNNMSLQAKEAENFKKVAIQNISFLDSILLEKHDSRHSTGIQCLKDASKKKLSDIQNVINRLKLESLKIKKGFEEFNQQNSKLLSEMKKINAELRGGRNQIDALNKDFSQEFSPVCRDIISTKTLSQANRQGGLLGIKNNPNFVEKYDLANVAYSNEDIWKQELLNKIKKIKDNIVRYGPIVLEDNKKMGTIAEKSDPALDNSIIVSIGKSYTDFKNEYENINRNIQKKFKHDLPPLDENFSKNILSFSQSSQKYFKKKLIHECVMGEKYDLAMDPKKILNGLKQNNSTTQGTNVINYRNQLLKILNQDSFFEDKLVAIRKLDKAYNGSIVYTYRAPSTGVVSKPPSEIYRSTIEVCNKQIKLDNTFAKKPSQSQGNISDIAQVEKQIQSLNKKAQTFTNDIANDIYQRVANCNGKTLKSGSCNKKTLNTEEGGFCIAHAVSCANAIRSCHKDVSDKINFKINNLKKLGSKWDESVKSFITKQQNYLNTYLFPPVITIMEKIRKHLPGATIEYNADTFIKMPLSKDSQEFGISMLNGGNLDDLQQLPQLIEKNLIAMLKKQKNNLKTEYDKYISDKTQSANKNLAKWKKLKKGCMSLESKIAKKAEKINSERQKSWSENRAAAKDFCVKYDFLRNNPAAGCDLLEELYSDSVRMSGMINPNVNVNLNRFMAYCSEFNNEQGEDANTEYENEADSSLKQLCEENDNKYENIHTPLIDMASATVPEEEKDNVLNYLQSDEPNVGLISGLSSFQRKNLKNIHNLLYLSENDYKINNTILNELVRDDIQSKNAAYEHFNSGDTPPSPPIFEDWKNSDKKLTTKDLFKIRKAAPAEKLEDFFINGMKEQATKILKLLQESKSFKTDTKDICTKHMNHANFQAAKNCVEKDSSNEKCFANELQETAWSRHFTNIESNLSQLIDHSKSLLANELGEQAQGSCIAPLATEPKQQKPSIFDFLYPGDGAPSSPTGIGI